MLSIRSIYQRITVNKLTLCFFLFSFIHCFTQGIIQAFVYSVDYDSGDLVSTIIRKAEVPQRELAWQTGVTDNFQIQLCTDVPLVLTEAVFKAEPFCTTLFRSSDPNATIPVPGPYKRSANEFSLTRRSMLEQMTLSAHINSTGQIDGVNLSMYGNANTVFLDNQCTRLLVYPEQMIKDFAREDIALIAAQFWLFCISFFGIVYESIPHLVSAVVVRFLITWFEAYATWRTGHVAQYIEQLIRAPNSPCHVDLFTTYFHTKTSFEIPNLVLHAIGMFMSAFFTWRLVKIYKVRTFKTVGPPPDVIRFYKFYMAFFVCLQLSVFWMLLAMGLWINELINGNIHLMSAHTTAYVGMFIGSTVIMVPWLTMGWFSVRRESKRLMTGFLFLGICYVIGWSIMFYSKTFRWTFVQFPFFACVTAEAFVVMIASGILGVVCWKNFGRGLAHFLYVESMLAKYDFEPETFTHDVVKIDFDLPRNEARYLTTDELKEAHL